MGPPALPRLVTAAQLRAPPDYQAQHDILWLVLFPALTDIRDDHSMPAQDMVEIPAGSGRFYLVLRVDDFGKGFSNEYRLAVVNKVDFWPVPIP